MCLKTKISTRFRATTTRIRVTTSRLGPPNAGTEAEIERDEEAPHLGAGRYRSVRPPQLSGAPLAAHAGLHGPRLRGRFQNHDALRDNGACAVRIPLFARGDPWRHSGRAG